MNSTIKKFAGLLFLFNCFCAGAMAADIALKSPVTGEELEKKMLALSESGGGVMLLPKDSTMTATLHTMVYKNWRSPHALLVPEHVTLDLNGSTMILDFDANGYGIRLASWSAIQNGTVRIGRCEHSGSQRIWHSAVSVGAAYGDGGTPDNLSYFSKITGWRMENLTIDQRLNQSAIQLMSESSHGVIRNIRILDSPMAALGIGLDWGTVGPISMADPAQPAMGALFRQKKIYSLHPHDILIQKIRIGHLGRNINDDDAAGIRTSGCYNITIDDVEIEEAADGIAIHCGDAGYEYALEPDRSTGHTGYVIKNVTVRQAHLRGLIIDGYADNIDRSVQNYGYHSMLNPKTPGIDHPVVQNIKARGDGSKGSTGLFIIYSVGAKIDGLDVSGFLTGIRIKDWSKDVTISHARVHDNKVGISEPGSKRNSSNILLTQSRLYQNEKNIESAAGELREVDDLYEK